MPELAEDSLPLKQAEAKILSWAAKTFGDRWTETPVYGFANRLTEGQYQFNPLFTGKIYLLDLIRYINREIGKGDYTKLTLSLSTRQSKFNG